MPMLRFHDTATSPLLDRSTGMDGARRTATVEMTLREEGPAHDGNPVVSRDAVARMELRLGSFADVDALATGAITRRYPAPGARDAEPSRLVLVEFADPALPWLYAPPPTAGESPRPWLVLVVGREAEEELALNQEARPQQVSLAPAFLASLPPLADSHLWAHVQDRSGEPTARLIWPSVLEPATDYVAAVVPAFGVGAGGAPQDAWSGEETAPVVLPAYAAWRFRTGEADDFLALALALLPRSAPAELGRVAVRYARLPLQPRLLADGALVAVGEPPIAPRPTPDNPFPPVRPLPAAIADDLHGLRLRPQTDDRGRPLLSMPHHGRPWAPALDAGSAWARELNGDPRLRGAAGIGAQLSVLEQDRLVDAVMRRMGPIREAEQRIRNLALGLDTARSLWRRRLPADSAAQVFLLGPAMSRIMTERGPLMDIVAGADRALSPALFTSAAQRVLRRGPARTALARRGIRAADAVIAANRCPAPPPDPAGLPTLRPAPIDPDRPLEPTSVARMADPATAPDAAAPRLRALAEGVAAAAGGDAGVGGSADSGTWQSPAPPVTLRVGYTEDPSPVVPFPRRYEASIRVQLVAVTDASGDRIDVQAAVQPSVGMPAAWRLDVSVAGRSAGLDASAPAATIVLPAGTGNRMPSAMLTLQAVARPEMVDSRTVPLALAPLSFSLDVRPVAWRTGAVEVEAGWRVTNLGDGPAAVAGSYELGGAGAGAGLPTIPPFDSAAGGARITLTTEGDGATARVRLRIGSQVTGVITVRRGEENPITLAGSPWLAPYTLAVASAASGTPEADRLWSGMEDWVDAAGDAGLVDASLDGTPLEGVTASDVASLVGDLAASSPPPPPVRPCRPVSIDALAAVLRGAFDPTGDRPRVVERVNSTIRGRPDDAGTEPVGVCPDLPTPVWELLRKHRGEWLLPGAAALDPNAVVGLRTGALFIEALLVGINQRLLEELAWRGLPIPPGCSPLRRFWDRVDIATGEPMADIAPIARWGDTPLADPAHAAGGADTPLVVLLRTELFRRYPETLVYLLPAGDPAHPDFDDHAAHHDLPRTYPGFQGILGDDMAFFGFTGISAEDARGYWVVLEEPSGGVRFWGRKATGSGPPEDVLASALDRAGGGAELAAMTLSDPIRVMIPGREILPVPEVPSP